MASKEKPDPHVPAELVKWLEETYDSRVVVGEKFSTYLRRQGEQRVIRRLRQICSQQLERSISNNVLG